MIGRLGLSLNQISDGSWNASPTWESLGVMAWAGLSHEDPDLTPERAAELLKEHYKDKGDWALAELKARLEKAVGQFRASLKTDQPALGKVEMKDVFALWNPGSKGEKG
jgi:hypothetical protein